MKRASGSRAAAAGARGRTKRHPPLRLWAWLLALGVLGALAVAVRRHTAASSGSSSGGGDNVTGREVLFYHIGNAYYQDPFGGEACPVPWRYTGDRRTADAVIYNTLDGLAGFPGPSSTHSAAARPGQAVVMLSMESGQYYPVLYEAKRYGATISADYRLGSDVPVPYYSPDWFPRLHAQPVPWTRKRSDALVAAFISNCDARNNRMEVLGNLSQLFPGGVHSYGKCGRNRKEEEEGGSSFGEDRAQRKARILSTYKFSFVPENSNDPGYVTEKVYEALQAGTVPIYMGAPDVHRLIPVPEAVVRVDNFSSTQALADYIRRAADDEQLYQRHVAWKRLPQRRWSQHWQEVRRLTQYSAHCRLAMHVAGRPHRWRDGD